MNYKLKNIFSNRKTLYLVLSIVLVSVFTLTIVYAALNTVLKITGNAEVVASSWNIYLDNVQLMNGSATTSVPTITDKTTASFATTLTNPGDYYMFTIDVVNNGSIDAMIDSIEKTPTLSETQAKYLNYIVEYQSGESINTKQLVEKNSFVRLKVKVEFRKDIVASDLPKTSETLNLSFTVKYTQADESGTSSVTNDGKLVKVVSGDGTQVGDEICIDTECFYVISSTDNDVTMLAKYNLYVGSAAYELGTSWLLENPTGIQDKTAKGYFKGNTADNPMIGLKKFSLLNYWSGIVDSYPTYVYNENSEVYIDVENYKYYLESLGVIIADARLIKKEELDNLGCDDVNVTCSSALSWVYSTTYWTGTAYSSTNIWRVRTTGSYDANYFTNFSYGVRPVITISKSEF